MVGALTKSTTTGSRAKPNKPSRAADIAVQPHDLKNALQEWDVSFIRTFLKGRDRAKKLVDTKTRVVYLQSSAN